MPVDFSKVVYIGHSGSVMLGTGSAVDYFIPTKNIVQLDFSASSAFVLTTTLTEVVPSATLLVRW